MSFQQRLLRNRLGLDDLDTNEPDINAPFVAQQSPPPAVRQPAVDQERSGVLFDSGRGYEFIPRDSSHPYETPEITKRRLRLNDTMDQGRDPEEYADPVASQFPVSAVTKTALYNDGYGAGYTKSPLDPGYAPPPGFQQRLMEKPAGQMLTPTNQAAITRPRTVTPQVEQPQQPQPDTAPSFQSRLMGNNRPRVADQVGFDAQGLRDIENKPLSTRDKFGLVAQAASRALGGDPLPTRRQRDITRASGQLTRDMAIQKERDLSEQGRMVPFQLPDGTMTMVPAKTAGSLASQQQNRQSVLTERKRVNDEHLNRWRSLNRNDRAKVILGEYNSGGLNGNPELLDQASRELGLQGSLKDKFLAGQFRGDVDANGNLIEVNQQTNTAAPVTVTNDGVTQPVTSFKKTQESERNRRFNVGQTNANTRAANAQAGADRRAALRPGAGGTTVDRVSAREAAKLAGQLDQARAALTAFDANQRGDVPLSSSRAAARQDIVNQATGIASQLHQLNAGYEAGIGDKGYPYYKRTQQSQSQPTTAPTALKGRTISQQNFDRYRADHGDAAAQQLLDGGVTIRK